MKYYYAVQYGLGGRPHDPTYFRFEVKSGRNYFVSEFGRTGPAPKPKDDYYREALPGSRALRQMIWRRKPSGIDESTPASGKKERV